MNKLCPQTGLVRDYAAEERAYRKRCDAINAASHGARENHIARVCARFELESDEFYSARDKAIRMINRGEA